MKRILIGAVLSAFAATAVTSCTANEDSQDEAPAPAPQNPPVEQKPQPRLAMQATKDSIQKQLVDKSCLSCHQGHSAGNRHVDLTDIAKITGDRYHHDHSSGEAAHGLIVPGCPKQSFFYTIMTEGKMPPKPAARISAQDLKAVEDYIVSLKPGSKCKDEHEPGHHEEEPGHHGDDEPGDDEPGN